MLNPFANHFRNGKTMAFAVVLSATALASCGDDGGSAGDTASSSIDGVVTYEVASAGHVTTRVEYPQTPPVGGDHLPVWQDCGIYDAPIFDETAVHSLEHGAVWITHQPELTAAEVSTLRELVIDRNFVLVSPYDGLDVPIVASAWGVQLSLDDPTDPRLVEFLDTYVQGPTTPEPGAPCTNGFNETA